MRIDKYTLAMVVAEDSLLNVQNLLYIGNLFKQKDNIDIVICENDEEYSRRYRGLREGIVQLVAYTTDDTDIRPSLTAMIDNPKAKDLGKGFILVNRSILKKDNKFIEKYELIDAIIADIDQSIKWIEKLNF